MGHGSRAKQHRRRVEKRRRKQRLSRRTKMALHFALLIAIAVSLWAEGAGHADWLFVALGVVVEVA